MEKRELEIGDIVQINPDYKKQFGGLLLVVTEPKSWGCQGYIIGNVDGAVTWKGRAYLRPKFEEMEYIGKLIWIEKEEEE